MALQLRIVKTNGTSQVVEVQPGAAVNIETGDKVSFVDPAQAAGLKLERAGNSLIVLYGEGAVELRGFYGKSAATPALEAAKPQDAAPEPQLLVSVAGEQVAITPQSNLSSVNQQFPPPSSSIQINALRSPGVNFAEDSVVLQDQPLGNGGTHQQNAGAGTSTAESDNPALEAESPIDDGEEDQGDADAFFDQTIDTGNTPPEFSIAAPEPTREGNAVAFVITRTGGLGPSSVNFKTGGPGTASASDYVVTNMVVDFQAGETTKTVLVQTVADSDPEGVETFTAELSGASNAGKIIEPASVTATIVNNIGPMTTVDAVAVNEDAQTANLLPGLVNNDPDPDKASSGDVLRITAVDTTLPGFAGTVSFDAATQTLTYAADADAQDALTQGQMVVYSFGYTVADLANLSATGTVNVTVTGVNDAPVAQADKTVTAGEDSGNTALGITAPTDVDTGETAALVINVTSIPDAVGNVYLADGTTFVGTGALSLADLVGLVFRPDPDASGAAGTFSYTATDPFGAVTTQTVTLTVNAVNDPPTATNLTNTKVYAEGVASVALDDIDISDVDPGDTFTATLTLANPATGALTTGGGGTYSAGTGIWTITGSVGAVEAALAAVAFVPTTNNDLDTTITTLIRDAAGTGPAAGTITLDVTPVNDAPVVGGAVAGQAVLDTATVSPFTGVTIVDVDNPALENDLIVTVTLDANAKGALSGGGFNFGGGVYTLTGVTAAQAQAAIRQLVFDPADNRVAPTTTETTTFTISVNDQTAAPVLNNTTTVVSTSVNDAPVIGGAVAGQAVNDNATNLPFSTMTISDVEEAVGDLVTVTVALDNFAKGEFTVASLGASGFTETGVDTGVYTRANVAASVAQAAIRQLVFDPADNRVAPGGTETTTFTVTVNDGQAAPVNAGTTVVSTSVNDAPDITGTVAGQAVNDTGTILPFGTLVITDADTTNNPAFESDITISVSFDLAAKGVFTAASLAASGFTDSGNGVYTASGLTVAQAQANLRLLAFDPANNRVAPGLTETTTFTITVSDGNLQDTDAVTTVISTSVNDLPTISGAAAGQAVNDNATVTPFGTLTFNDADAAFENDIIVTVTLSNGGANGAFANFAAAGFSDGTASGIYTLLAGTTVADAQARIRSLVFDPTENQAAPGTTVTTTFTVTADDGDAAPTNNITTVVSTSVNDAPVLGGPGTKTIFDNQTTTPFDAFTISDADESGGDLVTVTVALNNNANGTLAGGGFTFGGGVYTLTGVTASAAQTAIRALVFTPAQSRAFPGDFPVDHVNTETTTFTVTVNDGDSAPGNNGTTVASTAFNDNPVANDDLFTVANIATAFQMNVVTGGGGGVADTDPDQPNEVLTIVSITDTVLGTVAIVDGGAFVTLDSGAHVSLVGGRLIYDASTGYGPGGLTPLNPGDTRTDTFSYTIQDSTGSVLAQDTADVTVTIVTNVPPTAGADAFGPVNEDTPLNIPIGATGVAGTLLNNDTDTTPGDTVTFVGLPSATSASGASVTVSGPNVVYNPTGSATIQALGRNATVALGQALADTFDYQVTDGTSTVTGAVTVTVTGVNDAPVIGGFADPAAINDTATVSPFTGVTISDVDVTPAADAITVTVTLDVNAKGTLSGGGFTFNAGPNTYTFTGTAAQAQTAIRALVFDPANNRAAPGGNEVTTFTVAVTDGLANVSNATTDVTSISVNDAPTIAGTVAGQAVNDTATLNPFSGVTIGDPDATVNAAFESDITVTVSLDTAAKGTLSGGSFTETGVGTGIYARSGMTVAQATTAIRALIFNPTDDRVAPGLTETTTFTVQVNDGVTTTPDATTTVVSTSVNQTPTLSATAANQPVADNATVTPFSSVLVFDPDPGENDLTATVTLSASGATGVLQNLGNFVAQGSGVYTLTTGGLTQNDIRDALRQLVFNPQDARVAPGLTETTTFTVQINDSVGTFSTNSATTVVSTSINDAPVIGGAVAGQAVNDNATINPFNAGGAGPLTISDADQAGGDLVTVTVTLDSNAKGVFTAASLTASGFTFGGGVYTLSNVTAGAAQTAIRQLVFNPTDNRVAPGSTETTTFTVAANDGDTSTSSNTTTVVSTSVNDAPTATNLTNTKTYTEGAVTVALDDIAITDADTGDTFTATLTLAAATTGALTAASGNGESYTAGTGVWTITGTKGQVEAALAAVAFVPNTNNDVDTTITTHIQDAAGTGPSDGTITLDVTPVNDAPTATNLTQTKTYNEDSGAVALDDIVVSDVDTSPAPTITATLTLANKNAGVLTAGSGNGETYTAGAVTGVWTITGTLAQVNAALAAVAFTPVANNDLDTTITTHIQDAAGTGPLDGTITLDVTPVNDAPTATNLTQSKPYTEGTASIDLDNIVVTEPDTGQNVTATLTLNLPATGSLTTSGTATYTAGTGVWTITGSVAAVNTALANVAFVPATNNDVNALITTHIQDSAGTGPADGTITLDVTPVPDAPTAVNLTQTKGYTEGAASVALDDIQISDVDTLPVDNNFSATLTLDDETAGVLTVSGAATYTAGTGVWTITGTLAQVNAALAAVAFTPNADNDVDTFITTHIQDGAGTGPANGTITLDVSPVNDAPTATNLTQTKTYNEDPGANVDLDDIVVSDVDTSPAQTITATLTLSLPAAGSLTTSGTATYTAGTGVWTITGSVAQVNAALAAVAFTPVANNDRDATITTHIQDQSGASPVGGDGAITLDVTPANDNPTATDDAATVNKNSTVTFAARANDTDPDTGDTLTITEIDLQPITAGGAPVMLASGALVTLNLDGTLTYDPNDVFDGLTSPATASNPFDYTLSDGNGGTDTGTVTVTIVDNTPPTASNTTQNKPYTEGAASVDLDNIVVADADSASVTATLTLANPAAGTLTTSGTATYTAGTGVWTITGTVAAVNTALANVAFVPTTNNDVDTTINVHVEDSSGASPAGGDGTITLDVAPVNDVPAATNLTQTKAYTEDPGGDIALDDIVVSEVDTSPAQTITATLTLSLPAAGSLTASGTASYTAGTGVWTITGSVAQVNAALAAVAFTPVANNDQDATITTHIQDQSGASPVGGDGTITLDVTPVNDAPTATNLTQTKTYNEGDGSVALDDIVVTEPDTGQQITATLTLLLPAAGLLTTGGGGTYTAGTGVWTITGSVTAVNTALANVAFTPATNNDVDTTITTHIQDAAVTGPVNGTITLDVTPANDAPTATNLTNTKNYNTGATSVALDDIVVTDVDTNETITATLTLANTATGALTATSGNGESYTAGTGVWTITGTVAQVNAALAAVAFAPVSTNNVDTTITTHIQDATATGPADGTITLDVSSGAPVILLQGLDGTNGGFKIQGSANSATGASVAGGANFNGDRFDDVLVGAPHAPTGADQALGIVYAVTGHGGTFSNAGVASIGTATLPGFSVTGATTLHNLGNAALWKSPFPQNNEIGGTTLAVGDVNGDGFSDLLAGTPYDTNGALQPGGAFLVTGQGSPGNVALTVSPTPAGATHFTTSPNTKLGTGVAFGDVNGDGVDDMIGGGPGNSTTTFPGTTYVIFGNTASFGTANLNAATLADGTQGFRLNGPAGAQQRAGQQVASVNLNGDGFADVVITAPGNSSTTPGSVYVVFGQKSVSAGAFTLDSTLLNGSTTGGITIVNDLGSSKIQSVGDAGDVNGDGFHDLIVGIRHYGVFRAGAFVIFGKADWSGTSSIGLSSLDGNNGFAVEDTNVNGARVDKLGASVSSADFNGDGFSDLIIGAPGNKLLSGSWYNEGQNVYIVYGHSGAFDARINARNMQSGQGVILNDSVNGNLTGLSVAGAGDVNGDGFQDVVIGNPGNSVVNAPFATGESYVVFGNVYSNPGSYVVGDGTGPVSAGANGQILVAGLDINDNVYNTTFNSGAFTGLSIRGGGGDDTINFNTAERSVDGGHGVDRLSFNSTSQTLDLKAIDDARSQGTLSRNFSSIEEIDLGGAGNSNTLRLRIQDVLDLVGDKFPAGSLPGSEDNNQVLKVFGSTGAGGGTVNLVNTADFSWDSGAVGTGLLAGFKVYHSTTASVHVTLLVDTDIANVV